MLALSRSANSLVKEAVSFQKIWIVKRNNQMLCLTPFKQQPALLSFVIRLLTTNCKLWCKKSS